jgi:tetratricopeptide (TPR) repeat protein
MVEGDALLELGIGNLHREDYDAACVYFQKAYDRLADDHPHKVLYSSYLGLAQVHVGEYSGLAVCREAADRRPCNPQVLCNLAKAEFYSGNRRRAFDAIDRGLACDPMHPGLKIFSYLIDTRRKPPVVFLNRDHKVNRLLGRISYSLNPAEHNGHGQHGAG